MKKELYRRTGETRFLARSPSFDDPLVRERLFDLGRTAARAKAVYNMDYYFVGDEGSLGSYADAVDFDWGPHALAGFRAWLREQYGSLEALNAKWGSDFTDWGAVLPLTTEAARREGRFAPWADHRTYMEVSFARAYQTVRDGVRAGDPDGHIALSGTQVTSPWNGCDWYRLDAVIDDFLSYSGGNQWDLHRSFAKPGARIGFWTGYGRSGSAVEHEVWTAALAGRPAPAAVLEPVDREPRHDVLALGPRSRRGVRGAALRGHRPAARWTRSVWTTQWSSTTRCRPCTPPAFSASTSAASRRTAARASARTATAGWACSTTWASRSGSWRRRRSRPALSRASVCSCCRTRRRSPTASWPRSAASWRRAGCSSPTRRAGSSTSTSPGASPGRSTRSSAWPHRAARPRVARAPRGDRPAHRGRRGARAPRADVAGLEAFEPSLRATQGRALLHVGDADAAVSNRVGRGRTLYLNALLDRKDASRDAWRAVLRAVLADAGVRPAVSVSDPSGRPLSGVRVARYRFGDYEVVALLDGQLDVKTSFGRDGVSVYDDAERGRVVRRVVDVVLPRPGHVTNARTGESLGETGRLHTRLTAGDALVLALGPARTALRLDGPGRAPAGTRRSSPSLRPPRAGCCVGTCSGPTARSGPSTRA